jgi:hypothetical protein
MQGIEKISGNADKLILFDEIVMPAGMQDLRKVSENLMEMMLEVKKNPKAVEQADSMCEIGNVLINVAKTQIDQIKCFIELNKVVNK